MALLKRRHERTEKKTNDKTAFMKVLQCQKAGKITDRDMLTARSRDKTNFEIQMEDM